MPILRSGLCLEIQQDTRELLENLSGADLKVHVDLDTLIPQPSTAVSTKPAWINSRVDWARKPTAKDQAMLIGLEFESVTDEARKRIHDYIVEEFVKGYEKHD